MHVISLRSLEFLFNSSEKEIPGTRPPWWLLYPSYCIATKWEKIEGHSPQLRLPRNRNIRYGKGKAVPVLN
jgi:hypothetical protein